MSWTTIQNAIYDAVKATLPANTPIRWAYQDAARPSPGNTPMLVVLHQGGSKGIYVIPSLTVEDTPGAPSLQEITTTVHEHVRVVYTIDIISNAREGSENAAKLWAETIKMKLKLPSVRYNLSVAEVALVNISPVRVLPAILETGWESRAQIELECGVHLTVSETGTYIESVEYTEV